jgi:type IX secretion system PorP/SprF family membrane protein
MNMKKIILWGIAGVLGYIGYLNPSKAQDRPNFTMQFLQPGIVNPAGMTSVNQINAAFFFSKQMLGFDKSPMVGMLDFSMPIGKTNLFAGAQISQDRIGVTTYSIFTGNFAYRIRLNMKHYLSFGLGLSAKLTNANFTEAPIVNPADPNFYQNADAVWTPDIRLGAYWFTDNAYAGFAVENLFTNSLLFQGNSPSADIRVDINDMHFNLNGGWRKDFGPNWAILPSGLMRISPGAPLQFDINAMALFKDAFGFGITYRTTTTLGANLYYQLNKFLVFGYAVNFGLQFTDKANFTGHEAMIAYRARSNKRIIPADIPRF